MGFELVRIATSSNGLKVPNGAKCCFCKLLLDDGVCLSDCGHNACFDCMRAALSITCPIDGIVFNPKSYKHLPHNIEVWLKDIRMKCRWFDGHECTATGIALRNVRRHEQICANNPKNKEHNDLNMRAKRQIVKQVENWMKKSNFPVEIDPRANRCVLPKCDTTKVQEWIKDWSSPHASSREGGDKSVQEKNKLTVTQVSNTASNLPTNGSSISSGSQSSAKN